MLFNSFDFAVFLPVVFVLYWFVVNKNLKLQNLLVLVASLVFYGWWDWRFLGLLLFSCTVDYTVGLALGREENPKKRKALLWLSVLTNLGLLGFFKYYNFFLDNFVAAFSIFGQPIEGRALNIILPVGISFYTFQTLSYTIDVYKERLKPTKDIIAFFAFVSFFPQLVAGPIERATNLLPQFFKKRKFDYDFAVDGCKQILWGVFKKVVIADNAAFYADMVFNDTASYSGSTLAIGAIFLAFQIYGDFSGYSDIAIGTAKLFGFRLMQNFAFPYFSRDIAEFWRRWHISLTTWFRDYIFIPLGGSRGGLTRTIRNIVIVFLVTGFWHGASWNFIIWGGLNALYFLPIFFIRKKRSKEIVAKNRNLPSPQELLQIGVTFALTTLGWILVRAEDLPHVAAYLAKIFSPTFLNFPEYPKLALVILIMIGGCMVIEWMGRESQYALEKIGTDKKKLLRWSFYAFLVFLIGVYMHTGQKDFIYFQF